jgi:hypothetical protein
MTWDRDGTRVASHELDVGRSPAWRTWSYQRATRYLEGSWEITVELDDGTLLARRALTVGKPIKR